MQRKPEEKIRRIAGSPTEGNEEAEEDGQGGILSSASRIPLTRSSIIKVMSFQVKLERNSPRKPANKNLLDLNKTKPISVERHECSLLLLYWCDNKLNPLLQVTDYVCVGRLMGFEW